jgi:hypothetical protein
LQKYFIIRFEIKTIYGQFYGLYDILFSKRIGFEFDFPTFAANNNGTVVLLWQDRQA